MQCQESEWYGTLQHKYWRLEDNGIMTSKSKGTLFLT